MAVVISNRGRLISDLTSINSSNLNGNDLLIIQSVNAATNSTRKVTLTDLSTKLFSSLTNYGASVNFQNLSNEFTGAFYNPNGAISNLYAVSIRNSIAISGVGTSATISPTNCTIAPTNLTIAPTNGALFTKKITNTIGGITGSANIGFTGSLKGKVTGNVTGNITGNVTGDLTGNVNGSVVGSLSGNVNGNLTGDIYSPISQLVLDNGTGLAKNARFYGTSSYATNALTAAYASGAAGGLPSGGSQYQIVMKDTGGGVTWSTPITRSGAPSPNYLSYWTDNKTLGGTSLQYSLVDNKLNISNGGISVTTGAITSSFKSLSSTVTITSGNPYRIIYGDAYASTLLQLSASGYVTMSLTSGQTATVLVQNNSNYNVTKWSGSFSGGTANTKIYWKNGTAPTITSGDTKKDVITFVNINNRIFASAIQNFG